MMSIMIKNDPRGFTLIELVVTILIFAIGIAGIMKLHSEAVKMNSYSIQLTHAVNAAQSHLELLRGLPFTHNSMLTTAHTTSSIVSPQGITYNLSWDVDDRNSTPPSRDILVSVRWMDRNTDRVMVMRAMWDELD